MDLIRQALRIVYDPSHLIWIAPALWLADAVLCAGIIKLIPYTEIDWKAYMKQIAIYISGERDYVKIYGDTGPLVYPGGHVYIYRLLFGITDAGANVLLAQWLFAGLYLSTLAIVMLCYREAKVPPIIFPLLILSKRLHSIFVLRLFNDGFAVFFLFLAIYLYQRRLWTFGSLAYSSGLGVKMSLLLALPAVGVVLWQARGRDSALRQALVIAQWQILLGHEFLLRHASSYFGRAFELSRQFLFKWTVNWRFVGEETFLSRPFSLTLLVGHASLVAGFLATRWLRPSSLRITQVFPALLSPPTLAEQDRISRRVTPDYIAYAILSSIAVGCLCARSLHYQFYAYIAWSTPFLLWRSGVHPVLIYTVWAAQEWAWNVFPSTNASSMVVVSCLACTVAASWFGTSSLWLRPAEKAKA
ncbi:hypothetical protein AMS68_004063 [Peltaster fructicola]|uniref:Dol-P-Man:Man(5)GlcNAc(2)-PP-Dol alpha-1,3-mannosyltransferase n=1 Tax=Peltaster fructicola TaxID=286661 RepID=A0A6H0XV34_9PEZI|nr:hypothetical protein AMS68_004063 [Peltaster fructicola]